MNIKNTKNNIEKYISLSDKPLDYKTINSTDFFIRQYKKTNN